MRLASSFRVAVRLLSQIALAGALTVGALPSEGCAQQHGAARVDTPLSFRLDSDPPEVARAIADRREPTRSNGSSASLPPAELQPVRSQGTLSSIDSVTSDAQPFSLRAANRTEHTTEPVTVSVPGDAPVLVVQARPAVRRAIVYLHGRCSNAESAEPWAHVAAQYGTLIALTGDRRCAHGYYWGYSIPHIHLRIQAALKAVAEARNGSLDQSQVTLVGYSEGASRAEVLPYWYPARYPWVVLAGAPSAPQTWWLQFTRAVVLLGGEYERTEHLRRSHRRLLSAGHLAAYMELPRARHGSLGPEGDRVMADALWWLYDRAP